MPKQSLKFNSVHPPDFVIQKKKHKKQGLKFTVVLPPNFVIHIETKHFKQIFRFTQLCYFALKKARVYKIIIQFPVLWYYLLNALYSHFTFLLLENLLTLHVSYTELI